MGDTGEVAAGRWAASPPRRPSRPNLISLDLGFNDLMDLPAMVAALRSLGRLRLLVLQGNPLALLPHYRGFTVDSLARLCVLDDVTVSAHERHQCRGLGQQGGGCGGLGPVQGGGAPAVA